MTHPALLKPDVFYEKCEMSRCKASGPGGQRRNKVATAVRLRYRPTGHETTASDDRSSEANRKHAIYRLRLCLALEWRTPDLLLPKLWRKYIQKNLLRINASNDDFPALLANALDAIASDGGDLDAVAHGLNVSSSQLVRFLSLDTRALQLVNNWRQANDLRLLRSK